MAQTYVEESGAYAGWRRWANKADGRFPDSALGPIYWRDASGGEVEVCIDTARRHTNAGDVLHGGFLMSFADMALYAIAWRSLDTGRGATMSCNFDFLGPASPGKTVTANGSVLRESGKMVFIQAVVSQGESPVLSVSGIVRKLQ